LLGTWYGAWPLPKGLLSEDAVVYSFGVGEDITFDLEVIRLVGCRVYAFDPTPVAALWLAGQRMPKEFIFSEIGVAEFNGFASFSEPVGHSFARSETASANRYQVARLAALMKRNGHSAIDLLKLDIEGFEYAVIDDLVGSEIWPKVINVEYHHRSYGISSDQTKTSVAKLRDAGYSIYWISDLGREYGFLRR
jgi:FkbM family methyltransferase